MNWEWTVIIGSLVFALVVMVGANIWALRDGSAQELRQRAALDKEIEDLLTVEGRRLR
jgi:hypothetical protein